MTGSMLAVCDELEIDRPGPAPGLPLTLGWSKVEYEIDVADPQPGEEKRKVLKGISGFAPGGRLLAIMGGSGCGKTTFLNCVSLRVQIDYAHRYSGNVTINDQEFNSAHKRIMSFVSQDDLVFENDTPREALYFNIRVKTQATDNESIEMVRTTLSTIGITHCADTVIGTPGLVRGISGGERKRTNIGAELITNPRIMLLDEPTTGLDSVTALKIIRELRDIAHNDNRTILCTIHQPSSEIFEAFDDLMLMSQGRIVYHGSCKDAIPYFATKGHVIPSRYNPADFYMKILQGDPVDVNRLCDEWDAMDHTENLCVVGPKKEHLDIDATKKSLEKYAATKGAGYGVQSFMLMRRAFRNMVRSPIAFHARFGQTIFMSIFLGLMYFDIKNDQEGVQDKIGFLFMYTVNQAMLSIFNGAIVFPPERAVFLREQANGAYSPYVYAFSRILAELPLQIFFPWFMTTIVYWMVGLKNTAAAYFAFSAAVVLLANTAQSFGLLVAAAVPNVETVMAIIPITVLPFMLAGGLLASGSRLDPGFLWLNYLSFIRYGFILLMKVQFESEDTFECPSDPHKVCRYRTGDDVMKLMEFDNEVTWHQAVILVGIMIGLRILTALSLGYAAKKSRST